MFCQFASNITAIYPIFVQIMCRIGEIAYAINNITDTLILPWNIPSTSNIPQAHILAEVFS